MKKTILITIFTAFAFNALFAQDTLVLSLPQAIEIALSESPTIKVADQEIQRVEYSQKEIKGGLLPNVSLGASYTRALKKQKMFFDIPGMPSNPDGFEVGQDNTFNGASNGLSASIPLIAPALWSSIKLSELDIQMALESARASRISLVNEVTKAFYAVLMAQDSYEVLQRTYANSAENNKIINSKFEQGTVSEFETIRADVQLRNVGANVTAAQNGVELAKLQLKMQMGIEMDVPIGVLGSLADYEATKYNELLAMDTTALADNSDLKKFDIQSRQLDEAIKVQRAQYLPTLAASVNYNIMSMVNDENLFKENHKWFPTSNLALVLNIPIFEGGKKYHKEQQLKIQQQQLVSQRENLLRGLELQVNSFVSSMKNAVKLIETNKEAVRQAEKGMQIASKMYEVGGGTYLDVTNAELGYIQAGLAYNQAVFDYLKAKTDLEKVLGNSIQQMNIKNIKK